MKSSLAFSIAIDESADIQDNPQLAIFVRYVSSDLTIKEKWLDLVATRETTRGVDIKNALDEALTRFHAPLNKLVSVATDIAPAMVGKRVGLIGLMNCDSNFPEFLPIHCIIHCEHFAAKHFRYEDVLKTVLEIANFIRPNGKNHRQFRNFAEKLELEDAPCNDSLYCVVNWLSTSNVLSRFVDFLKPINLFLEERRKCYPQLKNNAWIQDDLMFLIDIIKHLQILNLALEGTETIISNLAQTVISFQNKTQVFQRDIMSKTFRHFPNLKMTVNAFTVVITDHKVEEYKDKLQGLLEEFQARVDDLQGLKPYFTFLVNLFDIDVINDGCLVHQPFVTDVSAAEIELIELQEDLALKNFNKCHSRMEFWQQVTKRKYPELKKTSARLLSVFSTTYCCESLCFVMKFVKAKYRASLTNEHLSELIRRTLTSYRTDFQKLANEMETLS